MADAPRKDGDPMPVAEVQRPPPGEGGLHQAGHAKAGMAALTLGRRSASSSATSARARCTRCRRSSRRRPRGRARPQADVYGVVSLVFWTITLIVSVKYVTFIMRADNDGEGGIMALIALVQRRGRRSRAGARSLLVALGIFGASLFYGDGMITPAISVLSAVEGLEVAAPGLDDARRPDHARDPDRRCSRPALRHRRRRARCSGR